MAQLLFIVSAQGLGVVLMANNKGKSGGLFNRIMFGREKSEGYARTTLPSNRWELFWDIFKGRFGKLIVINFLILMFFIPLFLLLLLRNSAIASLGSSYPFNQCFGVGYQAIPDMVGFSENIVFNVNMVIYLLLPICAMFGAFGLAGGCYVIRNMVWTEGIFVANDFWRGIKLNIKPMILIGLSYSCIFYITTITTSFTGYASVSGVIPNWAGTLIQIISYILLAFITIVAFHAMTMAVTYELKFSSLIRNSLLMAIGLLPQNIFFLFIGGIAFLLMTFGQLFVGLGLLMIFLMGFSLLLLVWTNFCQWVYDKFINDRVAGAKKNRGIYEKIKESDSGALKQYKVQLALASRTSLSSKPIKPITDDDLVVAELPVSFNRSDIVKLNESKQAIYDDHARYVEEHKNDPEFQPTEEEKALLARQDERSKRIEKAKRELAKRNKK